MDENLRQSFEVLAKAIGALEKIANKSVDEDRAYIDATIQRFEFSIELFWKLLKKIMMTLGTETNFPKQVLQEAFAGKLIDDEKIWLQMLNDRNQTSHTYNEELADKIYNNVKQYLPIMKKTYDKLYKRFQE